MTQGCEPIVVCEYDPAWPDQFELIASRARITLRDTVLRIEHVGSMSVPGLAAKPIVDLDVVVASQDVPEAIRLLAEIGYVHEGDLGIAGREALRSPPGERRHHLYVVAEASAELRRHLAFREALRADSELRAKYAALKKRLAALHRDNRDAYSEAKSAFIEEILGSRT